MKQSLRRAARGVAAAALGLSLVGCGNFFVKESSGGGGSTTGTGDYAYVANSATGTSYLNGYALSGGTLVPATGSPYPLGYTPAAMAITQNNGFLYVSSDPALNSNVGFIYGYSIGTGGALTIINNQLALVSANVAAMDISPDGQWLFVLDSVLTVNDLPAVTEYSINSSTGALSFVQQYQYTGASAGAIAPQAIKVAPNGGFIAIALGTGGLATIPLTTSNGTLGTESLYSTGSSSIGIYSVTVDTSNNVYAASTNDLLVLSASSQGALGSTLSTNAIGTPPSSIVLDGTSFVYTGAVASSGGVSSSQIFNFSTNSAGTATPLAPAMTVAPSSLTSLARESSGKYLLALGFSATSGLQMFSIGSSGVLSLTSSDPTGTAALNHAPMALTH